MGHSNTARLTVQKVSRADCEPFVIGIHYAHRWPSITYAYGLFEGSELIGVVTYGTPPSPSLRRGIAGEDYKCDVLELNRLCLRYNRRNEASYLIGSSLKQIPKGKIVVSFADISQGHTGIVYQATNFLYCGLSAKRTDWKVKGRENLHGMTIGDEFRGVKNRAQAMRKKYGSDFYLHPRPRKHRYIYICGDRRYKKEVLGCLKYKTLEYPKPTKEDRR